MKPAAQVQASIELLEQVIESGYPADRIMAQYFRGHRYIGSKDKAVISEQLYTVLRQRLSYEYLLRQADLPSHARFLLAAMLRQQDKPLADYFDGGQYSPAPLQLLDAEKLALLDFSVLDDAALFIQLNVPEWLAPKLEMALGDRFIEEMQACNQRANTDIRVNLIKTTVAETVQSLQQSGFDVELSQLSPWGIKFNGRVALFGLDIFKQGWFEVQDQGSQLLALVSQAQAGQKIVDFCAGAGGKTLALAAMMGNKGVIYACDVHTGRLEQLNKRAKRAGAHNIRSHVLSSENDKWVKQHRSIADLVLIDAPCSGTGTWRRSPDSRWNLKPTDLENLLSLQQSILQSASRLVKPGGRLLYATCSLLKEENEQQVSQFVADSEDFELTELVLPASLQENLQRLDYQHHQLQMLPGLSGTDGFYVCALKRKPIQA